MTVATDDTAVTPPAADSPLPAHPAALSYRWRFAISLALVFHLVAIVSAPLAMQPSAVINQRLFGWFQPYLDAMFLNHGYHFFAPEPGPAHVVRYEVILDNGQRIDGVFPDPRIQRPRLLYHRHFMLTETAGQLAGSTTGQNALDQLARSFADHIATDEAILRDGATVPGSVPREVRLFLRRHYIPTPAQVADGLPLDSPELYAERPLGEFTLPHEAPTSVVARRDASIAAEARR